MTVIHVLFPQRCMFEVKERMINDPRNCHKKVTALHSPPSVFRCVQVVVANNIGDDATNAI